MIIHPAEQNSLEWLAARVGKITASEMDNILTPEFAVRKGEMRRTYLCRKLAEKWLDSTLPGFSTIDMEIGQILEGECLPLYELEFERKITRVGLCLTDDSRCGASPDGLIGEDGGIEAKCPSAGQHIKYALDNCVPKDYLVQVHAALYVTGRKWWDFVSYHRRMPMLVVRVQRDESIQQKIGAALAGFLAEMDDGWQKLCTLNDGPPIRRTITRPPPPEPQPAEESFGLTP